MGNALHAYVFACSRRANGDESVVKKSLHRIACLGDNFSNVFKAPCAHDSVEQARLLDVEESAVGDGPQVEIVICPEYDESDPDKKYPQHLYESEDSEEKGIGEIEAARE